MGKFTKCEGSIVGTIKIIIMFYSAHVVVYIGFLNSQISVVFSSKDFCQIIAKVESECVLARYAVVQYKAPQDASLLSLKARGNSNKKSEPYYRTKPSVLWKVKATAQASETPKHIVSAIEQEAGGVLNVSSLADIMYNREQVYNAGRNVEGQKKVATPACHSDQILSNS